MPQFDFPFPRCYNTLQLLGYDYNSTWQLCVISLVTDLRRPLFADMTMAKSVLSCLLSNQTLKHMRLRAYTLMPDHLHFLAGVRNSEKKLPDLIGFLKSYTTQEYWKRSRQIVNSKQVALPSSCVMKATIKESGNLISASDGLAGHVKTGGCRIKELAQSKARNVFKETSLADANLGSHHQKRRRSSGEHRLHSHEPGA